jgi:hypothetical protein
LARPCISDGLSRAVWGSMDRREAPVLAYRSQGRTEKEASKSLARSVRITGISKRLSWMCRGKTRPFHCWILRSIRLPLRPEIQPNRQARRDRVVCHLAAPSGFSADSAFPCLRTLRSSFCFAPARSRHRSIVRASVPIESHRPPIHRPRKLCRPIPRPAPRVRKYGPR